jgi:hypothetical protein
MHHYQNIILTILHFKQNNHGIRGNITLEMKENEILEEIELEELRKTN